VEESQRRTRRAAWKGRALVESSSRSADSETDTGAHRRTFAAPRAINDPSCFSADPRILLSKCSKPSPTANLARREAVLLYFLFVCSCVPPCALVCPRVSSCVIVRIRPISFESPCSDARPSVTVIHHGIDSGWRQRQGRTCPILVFLLLFCVKTGAVCSTRGRIGRCDALGNHRRRLKRFDHASPRITTHHHASPPDPRRAGQDFQDKVLAVPRRGEGRGS